MNPDALMIGKLHGRSLHGPEMLQAVVRLGALTEGVLDCITPAPRSGRYT